MSAPQEDAAPAVACWLGGVVALGAFTLQVIPVLAPAVSASSGLPATLVGAYTALVWGIAMIGTMRAPALMGRIGAWPSSRAVLVLCAIGAACAATGHPLGLLLAAVLIGVGHGFEGPVAAQLLATHVPLARRPLWFSVKQTGVQLGFVGAAATLPAVAELAGWRVAALVAAALAGAGALALSRPARRYAEPQVPARGSRRGMFSLLRTQRTLRWMSVAGAMFVAVQACLNSFFVVFAVRDLGVSLVIAGAWLGAAQAGGLVGRVLWGWIGSRTASTWPLLVGLGVGMTLCTFAIGTWGSGMPAAVRWPLLVAYGLTASGWNGIFLAEVARQVPLPEAGLATSAALVVMTMGLVAGPLAFAALAEAASFATAFIAWTAIGAAGTLAIALARRSMRA